MWLLNTKTAALRYFNGPEKVTGGYAILSHVWGNPEEEDTFQKVQYAASLCRENTTSNQPSSPGSGRFCGEILMDVVVQLQETIRKLENTVSALSKRVDQLESGCRQPTSVVAESLATSLPPETVSEPLPEVVVGTSADPPAVTTPRDLLSPKIRNFLIQAEKDGFEWAWSDTCCIDKTSSTELSEAINSMFRYYSLSSVCYVYLADVHPGRITTYSHEFRKSAWHRRGWTLQELLAPQNVLFMSNDWTLLGNKYTLANVLEKTTKIPSSVLRLKEDFATMSIAKRMSWAARRTTTRVEDEAYCLLGIFGVNMPTIYGEGRNAFYRLQEEIVKSSSDPSWLLWGDSRYLDSQASLNKVATMNGDHPPAHAFARSPEDFIDSSYINVGYTVTDAQVSYLWEVLTCK